MISVYCVTNLVDSKQYVGWTSNIERRWREHRNCGSSCSLLLRRAIKKYGVEQFQFGVLEEFGTEEEAKQKEIEYISWLDTFENGYNLTQGGEGNLGWRPSIETRQRQSQIKKGRPQPHKQRNVVIDGIEYSSIKQASKILNIKYSSLVGKIAIQRRHGFMKLTLNPIYSPTKHTSESKAKISKANSGRKQSDKVKKTISKKAKKRHKEQLHPMCKSVVINGVEYQSIKDAAKQTGINYSTLRWRLQRDTNALGKSVTADAAAS